MSGWQGYLDGTRPFHTFDMCIGSVRNGKRRPPGSGQRDRERSGARQRNAASTPSIAPRYRRSVWSLFQRAEKSTSVWPIPYGIISEAIRNNPRSPDTVRYSLHVCCLPMTAGRVSGSARACDRDCDGGCESRPQPDLVARSFRATGRYVGVRVRGLHRRRHGGRMGACSWDIHRPDAPPDGVRPHLRGALSTLATGHFGATGSLP